MTSITSDDQANFQRYDRQIRFHGIGQDGQLRLSQSKAVIIGCGALGSVIANTLARAGVGFLKIVDRDFLELNNLQRQVLYNESDVDAGLPKAIVAANRLREINSDIEIAPVVTDVNFTNIESLCSGMDIVLDGTDNFEIRFLINDVTQKLHIPWIYGGCIGANGQSMTILPGKSPCLACLMSDGPPAPGTTATCDSAGILAPIINMIASLEANEAIKILSGNAEAVSQKLSVLDIWDNRFHQLSLASLSERACSVCKEGQYSWLSGEKGSHSAVLCGRNSVQLVFPNEVIDLEVLEEELQALGEVSRNRFLLKFSVDDYQLTIFPDARAIIAGTEDIAKARTIYSRYIGN